MGSGGVVPCVPGDDLPVGHVWCAAFHTIPVACLFVIINLPVVMAIAYGIANYKDPKSYERVMANATMEELVFILVLAIAFV